MDVGPFQRERLSVPKAGIQHQDRDVRQRFRCCRQIFLLVLAGEHELSRSLSRE